MKRYLALVSVAVLILGLAAVTYAVEFGASGFVRVRSYVGINATAFPTFGAADFDDSEAWMDTRFRLKFAAKANDYATAVIYFEGDSERWGEREVPRYYGNVEDPTDPGSFTTSGGRNKAGQWNADRAGVELKQFYIDFKVPGLSDFAPTNLKAGIQGFSVRSHVLLFADGAGVETNTAAGPLKFNLYWYKPEEGLDNKADDADFYGAQVWLPGLLPVTPGGYVLYLNANNYPLRNATATVTAPFVVTETYPAELQQADLFWIGAYADGKIGPVALKADFVYSGGDIEARSAGVAAGLGDVDLGGWLFFADAMFTLPMEMPIDIGGTFMYATGDDKNDTDLDGYKVPPGSEQFAGGDWGIVFYPSAINDGVSLSNINRFSGAAVNDGNVGGTWFARFYAALKPVDWLKVKAYAMYIGDNVDNGDVNGDTVADDSDIGIELGAMADIQIYKNLKYSIGAGYLLAGDALQTGATKEDPDDPWGIVSQLIFTF